MNSEKIAVLLKNFKITIPLGVVVGLILGMVIGWGIWPVQWTDLAPYHLRQDLREDYLRHLQQPEMRRLPLKPGMSWKILQLILWRMLKLIPVISQMNKSPVLSWLLALEMLTLNQLLRNQ